MKIIDPHLHLFNLEQGDYHWLSAKNPPYWPDKEIINKNFTENDLRLNSQEEAHYQQEKQEQQALTSPQDTKLTLAGFVHIEAGFDNINPWREIAWLESHCQLPFRSVANINLNLTNDEFEQQLTKLLGYDSVVGCRHILDEDAVELLNSKKVQQHLKQLARHKLSFDVQMPLKNQAAVKILADILQFNPTLRIIIDHAGWPPYHPQKNKNDAQWQLWQAGIRELSKYPNCAIKCSGWEMTERQYELVWQQEVIQTCLTEFGSHRVMLASNFPLCLFSNSYQQHWKSYLQATAQTSEELQQALCFNNTEHWYRFKNL